MKYNSPLWSPYLVKDVASIERVQKYFTKNLRGLRNKTYNQRLIILKTCTLESRRKRADIIYLFKILHNMVDPHLKHLFVPASRVNITSRSMRGHSYKLYAPKPRTDILKFSFICRVVKCWNQLPSTICSAKSLAMVKSKLTAYLSRIK